MKKITAKMMQHFLSLTGEKRRRTRADSSSSHLIDFHCLQRLAHQYEGKLLLRDEINLPTPLFHMLLADHLFTSIPAIRNSFLSNQCVRCHQKQTFGIIPCSRCGNTHLYCRNCLEMGRILACESLYYWIGPSYKRPKLPNSCTWRGTLSQPQRYGANKISIAISNNRKVLVWAVTGAGKTEMLFPGISLALAQGKRVCIASPRVDVVRELVPRLKAAFTSASIEGLYGGSSDKSGTAQILIATTHQLLRYRHAFDVMIVDEVDAFPYHNDSSLQFAVERSLKKQGALIYLTATPREAQRRQIACKKLDYVFVPVRFHGHPLIIPKWVYCPHLQKELHNKKLPEAFSHWMMKAHHKSDRQLLIFIPTIKGLLTLINPIKTMLLQEKIIDSFHAIDVVFAEDEHRKEKILRFRQNKLKVLLTTTILERGVTFPSINVAVLHAGHPIFDEAALIQIAGRAGRSADDPGGEVLFFHDGKTNAMVRANAAIIDMNKRAKNK